MSNKEDQYISENSSNYDSNNDNNNEADFTEDKNEEVETSEVSTLMNIAVINNQTNDKFNLSDE